MVINLQKPHEIFKWSYLEFPSLCAATRGNKIMISDRINLLRHSPVNQLVNYFTSKH
ncbi:hypothetical protein BH18THE2_BH18THE2_29100 [soil metagenome]